MVVELATILLGTAAAVALVLYAAPKGFFGHPKKKTVSAVIAKPATTYTPEPVQAKAPEPKPAPAPVVAEPAPSPEPEPAPAPTPAPAIYETVQPATTPALPPAPTSGSSVVSFGASPSSSLRPTRTYRRRTAPSRSSVTRTAPHRVKKH